MEKLTYSGYKYAPESIKFYNFNKLLKLPEETQSRAAYLTACGQLKEAEKLIKQAIRKQYKEPKNKYKLIGYFLKNSNQYVYINQLYSRTNDKEQLLYIYKETKQFFNSKDWKQETIIQSGTVTPGYYTKPETETLIQEIDKNRSVFLYAN